MSFVIPGNFYVEEVKISGVLSDEQVLVEYTYSDIDSLKRAIDHKVIGLMKLHPGADLHKLASVPANIERLYVKACIATESELLALVRAWRVRMLYCNTEVFRTHSKLEDVEIRCWSGEDMMYDDVENKDLEIVSYKPDSLQNLVVAPIMANWEEALPLLEQLETVRRFTVSHMIVNSEDARKMQRIFSYGLDRFKLVGCHTEPGVVQSWVGRLANSALRTLTISSPSTEMVWEIDGMIKARMHLLHLSSEQTPKRWIFSHHLV